MHQTMQNCLPVKVQHTNHKKVDVLMCVLVRKGRKAQFVRFLRMGVKGELETKEARRERIRKERRKFIMACLCPSIGSRGYGGRGYGPEFDGGEGFDGGFDGGFGGGFGDGGG